MNALQLMIMRLSSIPIQEMLRASAINYIPVMEDMNTEQLMSGHDSESIPIEPQYRNPEYARRKAMLNSRPGLNRPDLKAEGDFHSSIKAEVDSDGITFRATDPKTPKLLLKYGPRILGLTEKNKIDLQQGYFLPDLRIGTITYLAGWNG